MADTFTWTRSGRRYTVTHLLESKAARWREEDHPRDRLGRFIETGAEVRIWGGALAKVIANVGGGRIEVEYPSGQRQLVHRNYLTVQKRPNGAAPTSDENAAEAAPATGIPSRPDTEPVNDPPSASNSAEVESSVESLADLVDDDGLVTSLMDKSDEYRAALDNGTPNDEADERAALLDVIDEASRFVTDPRGAEAIQAARNAVTAEPDAPGPTPAASGGESRPIPNSAGDPVDVAVGDTISFTDEDGQERNGTVSGFTENGGPLVDAGGDQVPLVADASKWDRAGGGQAAPETPAPAGPARPTQRAGRVRVTDANEFEGVSDADLKAERQRIRRTVGPRSAANQLRERTISDELNRRVRERSKPRQQQGDRESREAAARVEAAEAERRRLQGRRDESAFTPPDEIDEMNQARREGRPPPPPRSEEDRRERRLQRVAADLRARGDETGAQGVENALAAIRAANEIRARRSERDDPDAARARVSDLIGDFQRSTGAGAVTPDDMALDAPGRDRNPFRRDAQGRPVFQPVIDGVRLESTNTNATGTADDPIYVGADVERAAQLIAEGKHVRLAQPDQVSTVLDELARLSQEAEAAGRDAVDFDLCQVSVEGTNLFCADNQGIARVDMPQLKGIPTPGSPADTDGVKDRRGKVDIAPAFRDHLIDQGIGVTDEEVPAANLRATQREMSGPAVAAMIGAMREGVLGPTRIFVTRDNYVVDGHHRWASTVALDAEDNQLGDTMMEVQRIDLDVGAVIDLANEFSRAQGIPGRAREAAAASVASVQAAAREAARFDIVGDPIPEGIVEELRGGSAEAHMVKTADGWHFTPQRLALHKRIMEDLLDGYQAQQNPVYNIMGGGPAAGKSTMEAQTPELSAGAVVLNADEIKAQLPEYSQRMAAGDPTAASYSHEESSFLTKAIQREAFNRRINVTLDGTGNSTPDSVRKKITAAKAAGYQVAGFYVTASTDEAVRRANKRGEETGRFVPESVIRNTHRSVSQVLPEIAADLDSLVLYDTEHDLAEVARKDVGGDLQIADPNLWDTFLAKATEDTTATGLGAPEDRPGRFDISGDPVPDDVVADLMGGSAEAHLVKDDTGYHFTPARAALHNRIMQDLLDGYVPSEDPVFNIMGGGPAAGKSTMEAQTPELSAGAVVLNADDLKAQLPEYAERAQRGDTTAAAFSHEESSYLAKAIQRVAFARKLNVTLDGTGDSSPESVRKKITGAKAAGYKVKGFYVTASTDEAVRRAVARGEKTGRVVPERVIRGTHKNVSQVLPEIVDDLDSLVLYDTENDLAEVVRKDEGGELQVTSPDLWAQFLAKAEEEADPQAAMGAGARQGGFGVETEADRRRAAQERARDQTPGVTDQ